MDVAADDFERLRLGCVGRNCMHRASVSPKISSRSRSLQLFSCHFNPQIQLNLCLLPIAYFPLQMLPPGKDLTVLMAQPLSRGQSSFVLNIGGSFAMSPSLTVGDDFIVLDVSEVKVISGDAAVQISG